MTIPNDCQRNLLDALQMLDPDADITPLVDEYKDCLLHIYEALPVPKYRFDVWALDYVALLWAQVLVY